MAIYFIIYVYIYIKYFMILLKKKKTFFNNWLDYNFCQHKAKSWSLDKILFIVVWCGALLLFAL